MAEVMEKKTTAPLTQIVSFFSFSRSVLFDIGPFHQESRGHANLGNRETSASFIELASIVSKIDLGQLTWASKCAHSSGPVFAPTAFTNTKSVSFREANRHLIMINR